jgi:zinc transporter, ZIP family
MMDWGGGVLWAALAVFLATFAGSLATIWIRKSGLGDYRIELGLCGGIMAFSAAEMVYSISGTHGIIEIAAGFAFGLLALLAAARFLPHAHHIFRHPKGGSGARKVALIAGTITLHNIPEGFAIAASFALSPVLGWLVTAAIVVQDVPEGLLVSSPLTYYGLTAKKSVFWGAFSGFVEGVSAIVAYAAIGAAASVNWIALAFSAGAMAYVVGFEIYPEITETARPWRAALTVAAGAAIGLFLNAVLSALGIL